MKLKIRSILSRWAAAMSICIIVVTTGTAHAGLIKIETNVGLGTTTVMFDHTLGKLVEVKYTYDVTLTLPMYNYDDDGYLLDCRGTDVCATMTTRAYAYEVDADGQRNRDVSGSQVRSALFLMLHQGAFDFGYNVWNYRKSIEFIFDEFEGQGIEFVAEDAITNRFTNNHSYGDGVICEGGYYGGSPCFVPTLEQRTVTFTYDDALVEASEPTTLAIFALGMIGLASRRYKKQS
jgi:hypothetical protein